MALKGLQVLELAGLAPVPLAGLILADFGATVVSVARVGLPSVDTLSRNKRSLAVNLKDKRGIGIVTRLATKSDVLLEPHRPGVMERLGLGPEVLMKANPRLIYARLTGYGQLGPLAHRAGHDINYMAISGVLSKLGRRGEPPIPPVNLAADFSGGSLICVIGILMALVERQSSGKGQVIDSAMVDGVSYLSSFLHTSQPLGIWSGERGTNLLDSGAPFYETYRTADGKYMSVGAIEPKFYQDLLRGLGLEKDDLPSQMDQTKWEETKQTYAGIFASKTQKEWTDIFKDLDACVEPVLDLTEARDHPHNKDRGAFVEVRPGVYEPALTALQSPSEHTGYPTLRSVEEFVDTSTMYDVSAFSTYHHQDQTILNSTYVPAPAPKLSRTPGAVNPQEELVPGQHTREVLTELGYTRKEVGEFLCEGVVEESGLRAKL